MHVLVGIGSGFSHPGLVTAVACATRYPSRLYGQLGCWLGHARRRSSDEVTMLRRGWVGQQFSPGASEPDVHAVTALE